MGRKMRSALGSSQKRGGQDPDETDLGEGGLAVIGPVTCAWQGFPKAELKPLGSLFWKQDELEIRAESWSPLPCPQKTSSTFTWRGLVFPIRREGAELSKKGRESAGRSETSLCGQVIEFGSMEQRGFVVEWGETHTAWNSLNPAGALGELWAFLAWMGY